MVDELLKNLNRFIESFDFNVIIDFVRKNYKAIIAAIVILVVLKWLKEILLILGVCFVIIVLNDKKLQKKTVDLFREVIHKK
jgi:hypothetical protein